MVPADTQTSPLANLKVMIVEDSFESRGLLKSYLKKFGIRQIETFENGSSLLKEDRKLDVDVLLTGYGLGYSHSGIELVHALSNAKLLPVGCKVIFITNSEAVTSASHPFRFLKCEVLRKPINPRILLNMIMEGAESTRLFGDALESLSENNLEGLQIKLESMPRGSLSDTQLDELSAIMMQLHLKLGDGPKAWQMTNTIHDDVFRTTNRLSIANALGDERKLRMTLGMLQGNDSMKKRGLIYEIFLLIRNQDFATAHAKMKALPSHRFSLAETELFSLLTCEAFGLETALEFLAFKLRTSLENIFFRNAIQMMMVKCYLYVLLADPKLVEEMEELTDRLDHLLRNTEWDKGSYDFVSEAKTAKTILLLLTNKEDAEAASEFRQWRSAISSSDVFGKLVAASGSSLLDDEDESRSLLLDADVAALSVEVSPEYLNNVIWFQRIFNMMYAEPLRAREYNRIGIHHYQHDNPYPALQMFYRSHLCAPKHASIAINLLDTLYKLGLSQYWTVTPDALIASIKQMSLRDNEKRKFSTLQSRSGSPSSAAVGS